MRTVAYKLAKDCPLVKDSLPDTYIVEWTYTDLHPQGLNESEWQFANEAQFQAMMQINNTNQVLTVWKANKDAAEKVILKAQHEAMVASKAQEEANKAANEALFQQFLQWKKDNNL